MRLTSFFQSAALVAASLSELSQAKAFTPHGFTTPKRKELWQPEVGTPWQIILSEVIKVPKAGVSSMTPDVPIWDMDLFENSKSTITAMQKGGKKVICYFSAGSWENWRKDKDSFPKKDLGKVMDDWPDERWVNISSVAVRAIMAQRIKLAAEKGCDAIDPDNMDGYQNDNGLGLTEEDTISYVKFLSAEAAKYNMVMGMKNGGDVTEEVLPYVAFCINESCIQYSECDLYQPYIDAGKPVFNIEYPKGAPKVKAKDKKKICSTSGAAEGSDDFSKVIKKMNLDKWVLYC
ncbi:related to endo alpha-1,4 polygalactosaminidase precusor [Fusarium proliferatum]|nr:related to endo alpha-1,4 polygalactosaminidase precusor [Fusarium proliferatum]